MGSYRPRQLSVGEPVQRRVHRVLLRDPARKQPLPGGHVRGGLVEVHRLQGGGQCAAEGVRYYLDCNNFPGQPYAGGCRCANDDCNQRRVACNFFRYGQCNTQIGGVSDVVCRLVICENPATVGGWGCNGTLMVDNNVCSHEAGCLQGLATPVRGGGGA